VALQNEGCNSIRALDEKILTLYAKGMTTRDLQEVVQQL